MKHKKKIMFSALAGYSALLVTLWAIQDKLVFTGIKRTKLLKSKTSTISRQFEFTCMDGTVLACFEEGPEDAPAILALPGNSGDGIKYIHWLRKQLLSFNNIKSEFRIVSLHYRGYGCSSGKVNGRDILNDLLELSEYLKPISIFGRSLGAGLGACVAAKLNVPAVLISPWDSLLTVANAKIRWVIPQILMARLFRHDIKTLSLTSSTSSTLSVVTFESDETINPERSKALYNAWTGPKEYRTVPGKHTALVNLTEKEAILLTGVN